MTVWGELPGAYFDHVEESSFVGLVVANTVPEESSVDAPVSSAVVLEVLSTTSSGVDRDATQVWVDGELAYHGAGGGFQPGWDGPGSTVAALPTDDLRVTIDPVNDFSSEQVVSVRVVSANFAATHAVDYTYSFTCEDTVRPAVVSARAVSADIIRVTFTEAMRAVSSTGEGDALNPDNYSFTYLPDDPLIAAVSVLALAVEQVDAVSFDVRTDKELTFWKRYRVTCGDIADDSSNGNTLSPGGRVAEFASWYPPNWPERRRFDLWSMFSEPDRERDTSGDLRRFLSALQDIVDILLWDIDRLGYVWDPDRCPAEFLPAMLADLGNPFNFDLSEARQRKLAAVLIEIYKQKGTEEGIINVIRFFLGIEVTAVTAPNVDGWFLGDGELGIDSYLGPSDQASIYTFFLDVDVALSDEERRIMERIIDFMKPAHTHYSIREPGAPEYIDHWSLGESEIGEQTFLHM